MVWFGRTLQPPRQIVIIITRKSCLSFTLQVNVIQNLSSDCGPFLNAAQPLCCVLEHGKNIQNFIRKGVSMDYSYIMSPLERKHIICNNFFF